MKVHFLRSCPEYITHFYPATVEEYSHPNYKPIILIHHLDRHSHLIWIWDLRHDAFYTAKQYRLSYYPELLVYYKIEYLFAVGDRNDLVDRLKKKALELL